MTSHDYLVISGLTKRYGDATAVSSIDLTVKRGEFVSFLGPSGSGKTTTLQAIAGFVQPDEGAITLNGKDLLALAPHKRNIGMVFQNYALFPHLSVWENVAFPLRIRREAAHVIRARVDSALERTHMTAYSNRKPAMLSGGQQQRVALARAFVFEPELLLMDEPLGALDKRLREHLQYEISALTRELGMTVIYVTHNQDEALAMSDRIAVYEAGRISQIGTGRSLYEEPQSLFVARFMGESNALPGVAVVESGHAALHTAHGVFPGSNQTGTGSGSFPGTLVIRPDDVRINVPSASGVLQVTVTSTTFLGSHLRVAARTGDGHTIIANIEEHTSTGTPSVNDVVGFEWAPDRAVILKHDTD